MRYSAKLGFVLQASDVNRDILIPRYYDPRLRQSLEGFDGSYRLSTIEELIQAGELQHVHGSYIPKIHYGTGPYPYVRTSDIANWEIKASPKHGVSQRVLDEYGPEQDVRPEDIFFVHEGTYLIGNVAMVTPFDGPLLYQHHVAKFRVLPRASFSAYFFLAALRTELVQKQVRSKQFSADIIDSVVGRLGEVVVPIPKDPERLNQLQATIQGAVLGRARIREKLSYLFRELDAFLRTDGNAQLDQFFAWEPDPDNYAGEPAFLGQRKAFRAFTLQTADIRQDIMVPKYYDPEIAAEATRYKHRCDLVSLRQLEEEGVITLSTGDEIGRLNYGSGSVPFVRTSDFGSYELLVDAKQGVSEDVWQDWSVRQDVEPEDIFLVRDGTYLVGTTTMVFEQDLPLLFCGGIVKVRVKDKAALPPSLLYALLNLPYVRMQMRSKQFSRDVIDTLGQRLGEVVLPLPRDHGLRMAIGQEIRDLAENRVRLRERLSDIINTMYAFLQHS